MSFIAENIVHLRDSLPQDVTLIAVSKTKPMTDVVQAYEAGQRDFGENKIQEMAEKFEQLPKDINWHMIGHVQGNKIKYMAPFVYLVHGIDKEKRLKELNKEAVKNDRIINCLLQVHIAKEDSKFGFDENEVRDIMLYQPEEKYPNLRIRGLMGMATNTSAAEQVTNEFNGLSTLFEALKLASGKANFDILSMGMSGDYELAIDAGSNMVRIGSSIFGQRA